MKKEKNHEVKISYDLMSENGTTPGKVIIAGHDISDMVSSLKIDWNAGDLPIIKLKIVAEKLDVSGKIKDLKTIKFLENLEDE